MCVAEELRAARLAQEAGGDGSPPSQRGPVADRPLVPRCRLARPFGAAALRRHFRTPDRPGAPTASRTALPLRAPVTGLTTARAGNPSPPTEPTRLALPRLLGA